MRPPLPAVRLLNETFEARRLQSARRQQLCMRGRGNFIMYYMFCRDFYLLPLPLPLCRLICAASAARLCAIYRPGYTARGWDIPPLRRLFLQVRPRPRKILPRRSKTVADARRIGKTLRARNNYDIAFGAVLHGAAENARNLLRSLPPLHSVKMRPCQFKLVHRYILCRGGRKSCADGQKIFCIPP